jgi:hypothetical protein
MGLLNYATPVNTLSQMADGSSVPHLVDHNVTVVGQMNVNVFTTKFYNSLDIKSMFTGPDKIMIQTSSNSVKVSAKTSNQGPLNCVKKIFKALRYTPVNAVGINYTYSVENPSSNLTGIFGSDCLNIHGLDIKNNAVSRTLITEFGAQLNCSIIQLDKSSPIEIRFNYHHNLSSEGTDFSIDNQIDAAYKGSSGFHSNNESTLLRLP